MIRWSFFFVLTQVYASYPFRTEDHKFAPLKGAHPIVILVSDDEEYAVEQFGYIDADGAFVDLRLGIRDSLGILNARLSMDVKARSVDMISPLTHESHLQSRTQLGVFGSTIRTVKLRRLPHIEVQIRDVKWHTPPSNVTVEYGNSTHRHNLLFATDISDFVRVRMAAVCAKQFHQP